MVRLGLGLGFGFGLGLGFTLGLLLRLRNAGHLVFSVLFDRLFDVICLYMFWVIILLLFDPLPVASHTAFDIQFPGGAPLQICSSNPPYGP